MSGGFGSSTQETRRITEVERKGRDLDTRLGTVEGYDARITALEGRPKVSMGSISLSVSPATSTAKTDANVTASSIILPVASNANGWSIDAGITGITPGAGSFTVSHTTNTQTRTFNYVVITPA